MRALLCREPSGIDGLELCELPVPEPGPGEIRIAVTAAGVNFADLLIVRGTYQERPTPPFVPGFEVAGVVDALGPGVPGPPPGTRVLAVLDHGGYAEYAVARTQDVVPIPEILDDRTAAALPVVYGTALGGLAWRGRLGPGETLLVHGAAGGVGLAAVEVGKAMGARVIATARGAERLAIAREHGADLLFDSGTEDLHRVLRAATGGRGVDVVFDPVGGKLFEASLRAIAWEGRIVVVGFASGEIPKIPANILLVKNCDVAGFYWGSYRRHDPARIKAGFERLFAWYETGRIRPLVSETFPLDAAREALRRLERRLATGKLVVEVRPGEPKG
ncbi:MAG: NADPH:quinone oxidoreductase family protein [Geminicoccaceae bacterium]|nr:NADPH:quinone oxidoreductase family protein [Geminicoccaceae bacterium]MDW8123194.1 NADPH:quinone oxidoreductase family protein [Geminicoccaceae bacterium]MDW8340146.1 NADPH:quinone oxidoreductase family protein [Geminicoccaceae bacterium]